MKKIITIIILVLSTVISYGQKSQKFTDGIYGEGYTDIDIKAVNWCEIPDTVKVGPYTFLKGINTNHISYVDYKYMSEQQRADWLMMCAAMDRNHYYEEQIVGYYCGIPDGLSSGERMVIKGKIRKAFMKLFPGHYSITINIESYPSYRNTDWSMFVTIRNEAEHQMLVNTIKSKEQAKHKALVDKYVNF